MKPLASTEIQTILSDLADGARRLVQLSIGERRQLLHKCIERIGRSSTERWLEAAWQAKQIPPGDGARAEDITTGPFPTIRYIRLMDKTLDDIERHGTPQLPGTPCKSNGRVHVPVFPTPHLFDRLLFGPIKAHVRMPRGVERDGLFGTTIRRVTETAGDAPSVALVLGAGNVSSIPITDAFTKIFQENQAVVLKMNPVNAYVGPVFEEIFQPLTAAGFLRVVYGDAELGANLIAAPEVGRVHITGSDRTHDAIVWGATEDERMERKQDNSPLLHKPITSELGNVSPWIIVPGSYSNRQLRFQAENIAASITNNASFNCIATKMLITQKDWPQRELFVGMIDEILAKIPRRYAYYPGSADRFVRFAEKQPDDSERLPWTLRRDVKIESEPRLFEEESFVCVCGETTIASDSADEFLSNAIDFVNQKMWGTLSAALTVPDSLRKSSSLDQAIDRLNYGVVGVNQWPGVVFALMSTPWGAFPGSTLQDIQSGIGTVHNTYLLDSPEKTVISSPLTIFPKPVWFSTHKRPVPVAHHLLRLYLNPGVLRLPPILLNAAVG
ncbi:MAG: aldehyde dehydrogenase family protein [Planctomycetales bacterium]|nr:aldehyde dehydrogenase family protein [Planctomycetales bacterium]